jgi:hypothetical protein
MCAKPIGKGYFVHLGQVDFHEKCFVTSADNGGASAKQVRHLEAAMSALKAVLSIAGDKPMNLKRRRGMNNT